MCPPVRLFSGDAFRQADGTRGTDEAAEVTTDALRTHDTGLTGLLVEDNRLMATITARDLTASATDTPFLINLWIDNGVAIQMVGIHKRRQLLTHQLLQMGDIAFGHIALEAEYEVIDDTIAILHNRGTYLHVAAAKLDKL